MSLSGVMTVTLRYKGNGDGGTYVEFVTDYDQVLSAGLYQAGQALMIPTAVGMTLTPILEIVAFDAEDVIVTSVTDDGSESGHDEGVVFV